jgi:hypothetical protein
LKLVGVYSNKKAAEEAKQQLMTEYECCGNGDIMTAGGCYDDEIDLVVRPAPMFLDDE